MELIIVDDNSTDRSRQIIEACQAKDSRVRPFFHTKNCGITRSANDALKNDTSKYLLFIGSDDAWLPNKLEKQLSVMESNEDKIFWSEGQIVDSSRILTGQVTTEFLYSLSR